MFSCLTARFTYHDTVSQQGLRDKYPCFGDFEWFAKSVIVAVGIFIQSKSVDDSRERKYEILVPPLAQEDVITISVTYCS